MTSIWAFALLNLACGPKSGGAVEAAGSKRAPALGDQVPDESNSQAFAQRLIAEGLSDLEVSDSGAALIYQAQSFSGDGTWKTTAEVDFGEESMPCTESGTWSLEPATSPTEATLAWEVAETNCVGLQAGRSFRIALSFTFR